MRVHELWHLVLIHSPHRKAGVVPGRVVWSELNREIATLNINQSVTSLLAAKIIPNEDKDILLIGTQSHLLAYHVHDNKDVFYQECPDGVRTICFGTITDSSRTVILVGGNSTLRGFDYEGKEMFWLAVGDAVGSIILLDFNKDGINEIIVGTEDYHIKVYKENKMIAESSETGAITGLNVLSDKRFAYTVSNGTIGVYELDARLWRVKSKNLPISVYNYDLLGQGTAQLITGWSNGKIDCRSVHTGEVIFKDMMEHGIAGIVEADYRSIGKADLIFVSTEGEVRGYSTTKPPTAISSMEQEQEEIRDLLTEKQRLLLELKRYEAAAKYNEEGVPSDEDTSNMGVIPANTKLMVEFSTENENNPFIEVILSVNNDTVIKAVIIFAEGIFKGEAYAVHPPPAKLRPQLAVPLRLPKDMPVDLHIKALVGYPNSMQFHVFELSRQIPRFSMYNFLSTETITLPDGFVEFEIKERLQRICIWINQNFLLTSEITYEGTPMLRINLKCLRNGGILVLSFDANGKHKIYTDDIALASDLIQSLANFLNLENLESKAHFPKDEETVLRLMNDLEEIQNSRIKLNTDVADKLGQIRLLLIKAEDSRINAVTDMTKYYHEVTILNKELFSSHNIRIKNHSEGVEAMKTVNTIIQKASRLRVGQKSADMLNDCRIAIESNDMEGLIQIIRNGAR